VADGHRLEEAGVEPEVPVEPADSGQGVCILVVVAEDLEDSCPVHSFHTGLAVFLAEPESGELLRFLLAVPRQVVIDVTAIIVRVNAG
jgi:hypothetical protein